MGVLWISHGLYSDGEEEDGLTKSNETFCPSNAEKSLQGFFAWRVWVRAHMIKDEDAASALEYI